MLAAHERRLKVPMDTRSGALHERLPASLVLAVSMIVAHLAPPTDGVPQRLGDGPQFLVLVDDPEVPRTEPLGSPSTEDAAPAQGVGPTGRTSLTTRPRIRRSRDASRSAPLRRRALGGTDRITGTSSTTLAPGARQRADPSRGPALIRRRCCPSCPASPTPSLSRQYERDYWNEASRRERCRFHGKRTPPV